MKISKLANGNLAGATQNSHPPYFLEKVDVQDIKHILQWFDFYHPSTLDLINLFHICFYFYYQYYNKY